MNLLLRILFRLYRIFSGLRFRAKRRFTRPGLAVLGALIVAAMMGSDTENNMAYQGFTLLLFLLLVAVAFSWFFRARFSAMRHLPRFGTVGEAFNYSVVVRNLTTKPQDGLTLLEQTADPRPSFREWRANQLAIERRARSFRVGQNRMSPFRLATLKESAVPPLPPGQDVQVGVELTPLRRGALNFTGVTLARPDPLGLCRAFARVPLPQTTLILPRRYPLPPVALPGTMKYQAGGVALASNVGQSEDFVSLRDYRRGDPLRHIHWRSWAKRGQPVVKEFQDEFFVRHGLVLDTFTQNPHSEAFEEAVSVAASFACTVLTQESLLDLLFVGTESYCFTAGRGLADADQMLEILASVRACSSRSFDALEHLVLHHLSVLSGCICVLLEWDDARRSFVRKLQSLGVPVMVLIVAEPGQAERIEAGPMAGALDRFHVLETGKIQQGLAELK